MDASADLTLAGANSWIESQLASGNNGLMTFLLLFLGGMLASLLPCVYPLYPITVSVIKTRGGDSRWLHPLLYYVGLVTTYVLFGVVAALTGGMLNEVMRYAFTNIVIGVLFAILALSIIDLWYLPILQARDVAASEGRVGTVVLGMSAGLLSSACVGPVVVGILLGLAANTSTLNLLVVVSAGVKMLAFGMGLGLPFLAISLFGMKLPRAGSWMRLVQYALSLLILYFGYLYLEKGLLIYGFSPHEASMTLLGSAIALIALFYWHDMERPAHERMKKAMSGLAVIIGVAILFRGVVPISNLQSGASPAQVSGNPLIEVKHKLRWHLDEQAAYDEATRTGNNVFIDFFAHWCANCQAFEDLTGTDLALNSALQQAVLLKIYDTSPTFEKYATDPRFQELQVGLPFFVVTDARGNLLYKTTDYLATDDMALFLEP
jgi:thiol:disulfide interchange protein DsbD